MKSENTHGCHEPPRVPSSSILLFIHHVLKKMIALKASTMVEALRELRQINTRQSQIGPLILGGHAFSLSRFPIKSGIETWSFASCDNLCPYVLTGFLCP